MSYIPCLLPANLTSAWCDSLSAKVAKFHSYLIIKLVINQSKSNGDLSEYALTLQALILRFKGELNKSLCLFQRLVKRNPANILILKQCARAYFLVGNYTTASTLLEEAKKYAGKDWDVFHNKGICLMLLGDFEKALLCLNAALNLMRSPDTYAQLYRLHILENDFDAATCVLEESLEYFPDNVDSLNSLGDLYARKARIGSIEKDILPSSNTDFIRKSIDFFIRSLLISPLGTNANFSLAAVLYNAEDNDNALIKLRINAFLTPYNAEVWNNVGLSLLAKGRLGAAISCLCQAIYFCPNSGTVHFNLALAYLHNGQYVSAVNHLRSTLNYNPVHTEASKWLEFVVDAIRAEGPSATK